MKHDKKIKDSAVSPVVGVMLMLVVTIIIAGIVAVFAGGIADTTEKTPTAIISAEFSQKDGLKITNLGGDVINFDKAKILVSPSTGFAQSYSTLSWTVKTDAKDYIDSGDAKTFGVDGADGDRTIKYIQPSVYKDPTDPTKDALSSYYGFSHSDSVGKYISLKIVQAGRTVAETEVKITA